MFLEEICCLRRYIAGGDMLPEEICYWREYVTGGDTLLEGDTKLKKVSSQRRYLAKEGV